MSTVNPDPIRNRPSDEGRRNDPHIRDESAQQPGVNTMSSSDTDDLNNQVTKTSGPDGDLGGNFGNDADPAYDDITPEVKDT
ncbi:MAG TPA: hypothetical protein VHK69_21490 [Chitinophagaceae bacterium]|nr:hypothetical protein [Chitinophagaceae bacterium]